jgi:hypothetical protein
LQVGDLFAITDELDSQLVRLGVFKSNEDASVPGSKLLTQAYDGIQNESRVNDTHLICVVLHVIWAMMVYWFECRT